MIKPPQLSTNQPLVKKLSYSELRYDYLKIEADLHNTYTNGDAQVANNKIKQAATQKTWRMQSVVK
jgi:hypothetical protein